MAHFPIQTHNQKAVLGVQWVRKESLFPPCMLTHVQSVNYLGTS
jgi:hypothetical protein